MLSKMPRCMSKQHPKRFENQTNTRPRKWVNSTLGDREIPLAALRCRADLLESPSAMTAFGSSGHWYFRGERRQPASSGCSPVTGKFTAGVVGEELTATSQYVASSCYSRGNDPRGPGGRLQVHSRRRFNSIPMLRAIPVRSRNYLSSTLRDVNAWLLGE